jgi:hypothetical protein
MSVDETQAKREHMIPWMNRPGYQFPLVLIGRR